MQEATRSRDSQSRYAKLLRQEVRACDDPVCCCEPEPRWLRFGRDNDQDLTEWEVLDRSTSDEL